MNGTRPSVAAGRVEAHVAGRGWGTVGRGRDADGNAFDAVCRMLGHRSGAEPDWTFAPGDEMGARYGLSSLPVFVGNTRCPDGAQSLEACALAASSGSDWLPLEVECTG